VAIESMEERTAASGAPSAPSHKYAAAQIAASIPCDAASSSPNAVIVPITIANARGKLRIRLSSRSRIICNLDAMNVAPVAWIAMVSAISDRPQA